MHEFSLARALLRQVDQLRRERKADRVVAIRLSVGEFSGAEPVLLRSAFTELSEGTPLEGAELEMRHERLEARCDGCGTDFQVDRFRFVCPCCRATAVAITRGEELVVDSVTMECAD